MIKQPLYVCIGDLASQGVLGIEESRASNIFKAMRIKIDSVSVTLRVIGNKGNAHCCPLQALVKLHPQV